MKQKPKKYFLIPLIIGICLFVVGLILIIKAIATDVPSMYDSGWFDAETARNARMVVGIPICFFGVVIGIGAAIIVYHCDPVVKKRNAENLADSQRTIAESFG